MQIDLFNFTLHLLLRVYFFRCNKIKFDYYLLGEPIDDRRLPRQRSRASNSRQTASGIQRSHRTLRSNAASTSNARVIGVAALNPIEEILQTNGGVDGEGFGVAWGEGQSLYGVVSLLLCLLLCRLLLMLSLTLIIRLNEDIISNSEWG